MDPRRLQYVASVNFGRSAESIRQYVGQNWRATTGSTGVTLDSRQVIQSRWQLRAGEDAHTLSCASRDTRTIAHRTQHTPHAACQQRGMEHARRIHVDSIALDQGHLQLFDTVPSMCCLSLVLCLPRSCRPVFPQAKGCPACSGISSLGRLARHLCNALVWVGGYVCIPRRHASCELVVARHLSTA